MADGKRAAQEKDERLLDYEGGYGGGRNRAEESPEHRFGDRGWGGGRASAQEREAEGERSRELPEGAEPVRNGPQWQEDYVRRNSDKYGQGGGRPIVQRGSSQSMGGQEHREQGIGSAADVSARGGYGIRETEKWPGPHGEGSRNYAGRGPKNYQRCDERICDDVCQRLTDDPWVDASDIEVTVTDGEVTLTGAVQDRSMKRRAEDTVAQAPGVRDVHNRLRVQPSQSA